MFKIKYFLLLFIIILLSCTNIRLLRNYNKSKQYFFNKEVYINYEIYGQGDKNIVLLHGFGASLQSWNDIRYLFDKNIYKLYLVDLKGFGFSSKLTNDDYSFEAQSELILDFINKKNIKNTTIIGHSYGGGIALLTYLNSTKNSESKIKKLILIDCAAYLDNIPFFLKYLRNPLIRFLMFTFTTSDFRAKYTLYRLFFDSRKITEERIKRYSYFYSLPGANQSMIQAAEQIIPKNYSKLINNYSKITIPTLIIWGENDPILDIQQGIRLHQSIRTSIFKIINDCGHIPHEEKPKITYEIINDFLED